MNRRLASDIIELVEKWVEDKDNILRPSYKHLEDKVMMDIDDRCVGNQYVCEECGSDCEV